jgi:hypothetical protein
MENKMVLNNIARIASPRGTMTSLRMQVPIPQQHNPRHHNACVR